MKSSAFAQTGRASLAFIVAALLALGVFTTFSVETARAEASVDTIDTETMSSEDRTLLLALLKQLLALLIAQRQATVETATQTGTQTTSSEDTASSTGTSTSSTESDEDTNTTTDDSDDSDDSEEEDEETVNDLWDPYGAQPPHEY